jgi:hypothetical protein
MITPDIKHGPHASEHKTQPRRLRRLLATTAVGSIVLVGATAAAMDNDPNSGKVTHYNGGDAGGHDRAGNHCTWKPDSHHLAAHTNAKTTENIAKQVIIHCFGEGQWEAADKLWNHESDFDPMAVSPKGGACAFPQFYPCPYDNLGKTTVEEQALKGADYIATRYGSPDAAWEHWQARVPINGRDMGNWY